MAPNFMFSLASENGGNGYIDKKSIDQYSIKTKVSYINFVQNIVFYFKFCPYSQLYCITIRCSYLKTDLRCTNSQQSTGTTQGNLSTQPTLNFQWLFFCSWFDEDVYHNEESKSHMAQWFVSEMYYKISLSTSRTSKP
ncbi:hypothetical protein PPL_09864 [Heterostelium album PN500]|uniref:Uncharacterized protein n=1 Tax=Heterostelium pallidum (strain ATCC 26659 / Pp 5 / PN500) TaxID=670386 RepID=D3BPA1_HETP5|nr:hypothetical protein PPL_09864 [Heterostelium album PN500]EFA77111.1 hypothetical protein PPL_09864 [Heterostelium album PN500]|eukprot:XP_020429240.1 hypothetical protein PPL_09864 [Heterostelium album PN500]